MYNFSADYRWVIRPDGAFAYTISDGSVKAFNATGALILRMCQNATVQDICSAIKNEYDVEMPEEELIRDVELFITRLVAEGYVYAID